MDYAAAILGMGLGLGVLLFLFVILVACYVLCSFSHMKALKALGYDKPWLAWIPYGVWFACADSVSIGEDSVKLFGNVSVSAMIFKIWWIVPLVLAFLPINGSVYNVINVLLRVAFLGCAYTKMYARLEYKAESDTQAVGYVSGLFPIVAVVKFLMLK